MRIMYNEDDNKKIVEVTCVNYEEKEKAVFLNELNYEDGILIYMSEKRYNNDLPELLKSGFIDWSEFNGKYDE